MKFTFTTLTRAEFAAFTAQDLLNRPPKSRDISMNNFLQSPEMFDRYNNIGREAYLLGLKQQTKQGTKLILAGLFVATRSYGYGSGPLKYKVFNSPGGFLGDLGNAPALVAFTSSVKKFLRKKRGMILQISPNMISEERDIDAKIVENGENHLKIKHNLEQLGYKYLGEYEQAKWVYKLPTKDIDLDETYRNFRKGHKLSIRYAKDRYGVKIRELAPDELKILTELAAEAGEYHGFRPPSLDYFETMRDAFGDKVKFYVTEMPDPATAQTAATSETPATKTAKPNEPAKNSAKPVVASGAMFVLYGPEIVYLYSGSRREYKKFGGPHLLQWQMIQEAARNGYENYNFYGVRPTKGSGVYHFKRGFKGSVVELLGTFLLPLNLPGRLYAHTKRPASLRDIS